MRSAAAAILIATALLGCGDDGPHAEPSLCAAKHLAPWTRSERGVGGAVTFDELMYHPAAGQPEWIELSNPLAIDVDLSGFRLAGDVTYRFPEGTRIAPGGLLVVDATAFTGALPDGGGTVELWNNGGRLLDAVDYRGADPWPVLADGSGASLAKRAVDRTSEPPESWTASARVGGTPGAANDAAATTGLAFNEVDGAATGDFWIELVNRGAAPLDTAGYAIASSTGAQVVLPAHALAPGELVLFTAAELGFGAATGDDLFLSAPDRTTLADGVRIVDVPRGRDAAGTDWRYPDVATPGEPNVFVAHDDLVIDEIMYHAPPATAPDGSLVKSPREWIELVNRGAAPLDAGGYQLVDAVAYEIPAGTVIAPGGFLVIGNDAFAGSLSDSGDDVVLRDPCGNVVDEVHYQDGGAWPALADGGGSSLELRNPDADNANADAWAASDETALAAWQTITYQGVAAPSSVGPDGVWQELVIGLLDDGVALVDDVSVVVDPATAPAELVSGGDFETGGAAFRLLGDHRHSEVIVDPTDPSNHVLRLVATGATEHMHNHVETTLAAAIANGRTYRISLRARWQGGSNLLNTRLYFNRLPRTTALAMPSAQGTPGASNRAAEANLGPTYRELHHAPAVPAPGTPVVVSVAADDPDGVAALTLWYAVDGGAPASVPMTADADGRYRAEVPGHAAAAVVQFWIAGADAQGATSMFPALGPAARALWKVDDGLAATNGLHNLRIVMTPADVAWLFTPANLMSNDLLGATVIDGERDVYYDVGVRLKSSERGRGQPQRVGFALRFSPAQRFRGIHDSVMVDRSQGVGYGQRELFFDQIIDHAGSVHSQYDDLIQVLAPRPDLTGPAHLQLARFGDLLLDFQFDNGGDGALYEYELIYFPTTTDDGTPTGHKLPEPDSVVGIAIRDAGDDEESYRLPFIAKNNRWRDDYRGLIHFAKVFGQTGAAFDAQVADVIDVDEWLRAFAFATLSGAIDNFASGAQHNGDFYVRPSDGRVLYLPHDLDFLGGSRGPLVGSPELAKLIATPARARAYYGHLYDIVQTSFNGTYMAAWADQFGRLLPGQDFAGHLAYITDRAAWTMTLAPNAVLTAIPRVTFAITTNGGAALTVAAPTAILDGSGWIDVDRILRSGTPLDLTWPTTSAWRATVTLACGANAIQLDAVDRADAPTGTDMITVTRTGTGCP